MKKREFLKTLAVGMAGLRAGRLAWGAETPGAARRPPKVWVWMNVHEAAAFATPDDWKHALEKLRGSKVDAVLIEIYDGQHAYWPSKRLPTKSDVLGTAIKAARHTGIEIHAWMWTAICRVPEILQKHPDWYNVNAKGESTVDKPAYVDYYRFLDTARPEVREFVQQNVIEICDHPGLAGVHLDYVRHPDAILPKALWPKYNLVQDRVYPQFDYGYTEYNRARFKKAHGVDPMEIKDPTNDKDWMQYRWDAVTDMVNDYLVPAAHARGRLITAAVFPGPTLARQIVRQDWGHWKLDAFLPMLYNTFYEEGPDWVKRETVEAVKTVSVPIYSGLYPTALDGSALAADVRAALDGGASGISLHSFGAMNDERWKAVWGALDAAKKG